MLLSYWAWLKKAGYWKCNNMESLQSAKNAICQLVNKLKQLFPQSTGSRWNIPKLHEQLPIAYNIHLWGSHRNIHTGPQELNHIENTKKLCNCTQKRKAVLDAQIANLLIDGYIINHTHKLINYQNQYNTTCIAEKKSQCNEVMHSTHMASKFKCHMKTDFDKVNDQLRWMSGQLKGAKIENFLIDLILQHHFLS